MSVTPYAIAVQGLRYSPVYIAVQGLIAFIAGGGSTGGEILIHMRRRHRR